MSRNYFLGISLTLLVSIVLTACGGTTTTAPATAATLSMSFTPTKAFRFAWTGVSDATSYKLKEAITADSGYTLINEVASNGFDHIDGTGTNQFDHIVPLYGRLNAKYILESCNVIGCAVSEAVFTSTKLADMVSSVGYLKASNAGTGDYFGASLSLSADGTILAVGADIESSNATGVNGDQTNNSLAASGAVYVFTRSGTTWSQQAYLKASNTGSIDTFGVRVSLSADGKTLAVSAPSEDSNTTGVNGDQTDNSLAASGAVYVFNRSGTTWIQQAYLKASNTGASDYFGGGLSLSPDGKTLAIGAQGEGSNATGINGDQTDNSKGGAGAVYVFTLTDSIWSQQAYIKASDTSSSDFFGVEVSLSTDGNTLAVGAMGEESNSIGINGDDSDNSLSSAGAVYVFTRNVTVWSQEAYIKASNAGLDDNFGRSVSLNSDGNTLAVGAWKEGSNATGINGDQTNNSSGLSGAVYVYTRSASTWSQQAYIKASNTGLDDKFGAMVKLSADGNTLAIGADREDSNAIGINGNQADNSLVPAGALYVFTRSGNNWSQQAYVKASNTGTGDEFGENATLSADGKTLAVGADREDSNATGSNGNQSNNSFLNAGAVYVY